MVALSGCNHFADARLIDSERAELNRTVDSIPSCRELDYDAAKNPWGLWRGTLRRGDGICTQLYCPRRACCNPCGGWWELVEGSVRHSLRMEDGATAATWVAGWGAMDCTVDALGAGPAREVQVTGTRVERDGAWFLQVHEICIPPQNR